MQIKKFLESEDIYAYWQEIGYRCSPIGCAYIVWQSPLQPVAEKFAAWEELLQTLPDRPLLPEDSPMRTSFPQEYADSLHSFLRAYLALQRRVLAEFYRSGDSADYFEDGDDMEFGPYSSAEACIRGALQMLTSRRTRAQVCKRWRGEEREIVLSVRADGAVMDVSEKGLPEEEEKIWGFFSGLHLDFPIPFKRGDFVASSYSPFTWVEGGEFPFVLHHIAGVQDGTHSEAFDKLFCMGAFGYFASPSGAVTLEPVENYLALRAYHGDFTGAYRILEPIAAFDRGEIDLKRFIEIYRSLKAEKGKED